jgi:hypothetical protein
MKERDSARIGQLPPEEASRADSPIYTAAGLNNEFRQSEILTNLSQFTYDSTAGNVSYIVHEHSIILMQDCDLLWDYEARREGRDPYLNGILIYEAEPVERGRARLQGSDIWRRVRDNREERYHFLEAVPKEQDSLSEGLPGLIVDFRRFFTLSVVEIARQCSEPDGAKRRCRLEAPYREHLQSRAAFYLQRVMLPRPHTSTWAPAGSGRHPGDD